MSNADEEMVVVSLPSASERRRSSFPQFSLLSEDLVVYIIAFVAQVPFEDSNERREPSPITNLLPLVSKHFRNLCRSNFLWQTSLERLIIKEPFLWREGLIHLHSSDDVPYDATPKQVVKLVHDGLQEPGYYPIFRMLVESFIRFTGPVFCMSGVVQLGEPIHLHFFEPRYRLLIREVMEGYTTHQPGGAVLPRANQGYPQFIYANQAPFVVDTPASLVQVRQCTIHANGTADVMLMPIAFVTIRSIWERPNSGGLREATCVRVTAEQSQELDQQAAAQGRRDLENPLVQMLMQNDDVAGGGLQGPMRAMMAFLLHDQIFNDSDEEDESDDEMGVAAD